MTSVIRVPPRLLTLLAIGVVPLSAQTVYLRTPGTGFCKVVGAASTTPIRISVNNASLCGLANGQTILVTEVRGNTAANIHLENAGDTVNVARIVTNLTGNSFELRDLANNPVAASGSYINGGRVGRATAYTMKSHPRMYLDGPGGAITASISDTGPTGRANAANIPFTALKNAGTQWGTAWGDDRSGSRAAGNALIWLANGDTAARANALASLANITQVLGTPACDETSRGCAASGSNVGDYPLEFMEIFSLAYSIMHDQMAAGDRTNYLEFILSDLSWNQGGIGYTGTAKTKGLFKTSGPQRVGPGTVTADGLAVTGAGTSFLADVAAGDIVNLPALQAYGYGYQVAAVNSDTSLTLVQPVGGGNPSGQSVPAGSLYQVAPAWNDTMYGFTWFTKHFDYSLMCGGATHLDLPETTLASCDENYGLNAGLYQSPTNNLILARMMGYYAIGVSTCGDDPRGCLLLSLANEWFVNLSLPRAMAIWTGYTQSNPSYQQWRMQNLTLQIQAMNKNSFVEQPDYLAGTDIVGKTARWGIAAHMGDIDLLDGGGRRPLFMPNTEPALYAIDGLLMHAQLASVFLAPLTNESRYFKHWLTTQLPYDENFIRYASGEATWWHFLYNDPASTPLTAPTTMTFPNTNQPQCAAIYGAANCPATLGKYMGVSVQNWNADRTYLALNGHSYAALDHGDPEAGGRMLIVKNGHVLMGPDSSDFYGERINRDYTEIGGTMDNMEIYPGIGPVSPYWMAGDDNYMVSNLNVTGTYKAAANATSVSRQMIHLKSGGLQDYIVDHVRAVTSAPMSIRGMQHSQLRGCGTPAATTCIVLNSGSATVTNTHPNPDAGIVSKVLAVGGNIATRTDSGSPTDGSYTGGKGKTFRWHVCPTSNGSTCAAATTAEWVVVHKPSTNLTDTLPPIVQGASGVFRIVEIQDPVRPKVAVFTAAGATAGLVNFATSHAGTGQYVVSGLAPGPYSISRNGTPVGIRVSDPGGNSIGFESEAGNISIVPGPPPLGILTETLPNAALGKTYHASVTAFSSTTPYTWQHISGTICAGLSLSQSGNEALISGSATLLGTCTFTLRVVNSTVTENASRQFTITVVEPGPPVGMATTWLPVGHIGDSYTGGLKATGGTLPLTWSVTAGGLCPGLVLEASTGWIRGTPTQLGVCVATFRVTDTGNEFVERQFFIAVLDSDHLLLSLSPVAASRTGAIFHFGRKGLDFATPCSLVLRQDNASGTILATLPSSSGPSRRTLVAAGLPAGQTIHSAVTCGAESAEGQFATGSAPPAARSVKLVFHPPAHTPPVADVLVYYDASPSLQESLVASCAGGTCTAVVSTTEPILFWRGVYRDASANVVATSGLHRIAP